MLLVNRDWHLTDINYTPGFINRLCHQLMYRFVNLGFLSNFQRCDYILQFLRYCCVQLRAVYFKSSVTKQAVRIFSVRISSCAYFVAYAARLIPEFLNCLRPRFGEGLFLCKFQWSCFKAVYIFPKLDAPWNLRCCRFKTLTLSFQNVTLF